MGTAFCQNEVCFCRITVWNHNTPKWKLAEIYRGSPKPASLMFVRVGFGPEWKIWFIESLWLRNLQATEKRFSLGTTNPGLLSPSTSALTTVSKTFFLSLKFCECARLNRTHPNKERLPSCLPGQGQLSSLGAQGSPGQQIHNLHLLQTFAALRSSGSRWEHGGCLEK